MWRKPMFNVSFCNNFHARALRPLRYAAWLFVPLSFLGGCASYREAEQTQIGANFPASPGRTYFVRKTPFSTTILVCDGGPRDAVCFEKPH
jgi:hypothetical protein